MKKKKIDIIKETIGELLEKNGYQYKGYEYHTWTFEAVKEEVRRTILISLNRFAPELKLSFYVYIYGLQPIDAKEIIQKGQYPEKFGWWDVNTEEEFTSAIKDFGDIIQKYGLKAIEDKIEEERNRPRPTKEMVSKLHENYEEISNEFEKKYGLETYGIDNISIEKYFSIIEEIINREENRTDEKREQDCMIEIAAFLGERIRKHAGGKWVIEEGQINFKKQDGFAIFFPALFLVFNTWRSKDIKSLVKIYETLCNIIMRRI